MAENLQTGNFGTKTQSALENLGFNGSELDEKTIEKIKENCGENKELKKDDVPEPKKDDVPEPQKDVAPEPQKDVAPEPQKDDVVSTGENGENIYKELKDRYKTGDLPYIFKLGRRLKFKGQISEKEMTALNDFLFKNGYSSDEIKQRDREYGIKRVWFREKN